jgi:hypothetical protein
VWTVALNRFVVVVSHTRQRSQPWVDVDVSTVAAVVVSDAEASR